MAAFDAPGQRGRSAYCCNAPVKRGRGAAGPGAPRSVLRRFWGGAFDRCQHMRPLGHDGPSGPTKKYTKKTNKKKKREVEKKRKIPGAVRVGI